MSEVSECAILASVMWDILTSGWESVGPMDSSMF